MLKTAPIWTGDGRTILFVGAEPAGADRNDVYSTDGSSAPVRLTEQPGFKSNVLVDPKGRALVYTVAGQSPIRQPGAPAAAPAGRGGGGAGGGAGAAGGGAAGGGPNPCGGGGRGGGGGTPTFAVVDLAAKTTRTIAGQAATMSADGSTIAWLNRDGGNCVLTMSPALSGAPTTVRTASRLDSPALSPDGSLVAYDMMPLTDWEIYVSDGKTERRITHDIQHDILPRFLTNTTLLGMIGEPRHRRSHLYDVATGERTRVFANNTLRTISPEYIWLPSADGTRLVIQAERDGDTISPERGVYSVDLTQKVSVADLSARVGRQLADENDLRARSTKAFQPVADLIKRVVSQISTTRIYEYEKAMFEFDTKYIGRPGNLKAIDYLTATYASFGYTPEQQWFQPRQAQGARTANVVATLKGTENPELIYVVGSHFDSVQAGPGADDDTTGTCVLLEAARALHDTPLPATVVFASFTGEEAGDLGSAEFVRLAAAAKWHVAGALNNDMIGWAGESGRMDNTIRYSNAGIKDLQHGGAILFSNLVTYDAKYYKGTDASAFFDGWGDIVGGFGSYPGARQPELPPAVRHHRDDQLPAGRGDGQGDRRDDDLPGVEPVAPRRSQGRAVRGGRDAHVDAESGIEREVVRDRVRTGGGSAAHAHHRDDGEGHVAGAARGYEHRRQGRERARPRRLGLGANRRTVDRAAGRTSWPSTTFRSSDRIRRRPGRSCRLRRPRRRRGGLCWARRRSSLARD